MASRARTRLTLDEVLLGVIDDDFGKHNLARWEIVAPNNAVSSEPTEDHNVPGECSATSPVSLACYDSGSEDDDQEDTLDLLVSRAHAYKKYRQWLRSWQRERHFRCNSPGTGIIRSFRPVPAMGVALLV